MIKKALFFLTSTILAAVSFGQLAQAASSTNQFTITDYTIEYGLSRDAEQRSILTTKETITADFPRANVNHGIERAVPTSYDGHPTSFKISSVTNQLGSQLTYTTYSQNGNTIIRIGDADTYVHGTQTYVITYTQRDVTKYFANTGRDEFYWDTNGTDWKVPIKKISVSLTVDDSVADALTGDTACYQGITGSTDTCVMQQSQNVFTTTGEDLSRGENITLAVGFKPNTFAVYKMSLFEKIVIAWIVIQVVLVFVVLGLVIWLSVRYYRQSNRTREHDPIIAEYIPPKDTSVITSASILSTTGGSSFAALLIDLAVRHYIKIYQVKEKSFFSLGEYELEIVKPIDSLLPDEKEILTDIFTTTTVGSRLNMKTLRNNTALYARMSDNSAKFKVLIRGEYGLRHKAAAQSSWYKNFAAGTVVAALILFSPVLLILAVISFIMSFTLWPLTNKGLALVRYLKGLKLYISVAEEERLRMLQSPEGAEKVQVGDASDPKQLVKLYERTLPYAILFGQEKEWSKQLGAYYEAAGTQPGWYSGTHGNVFNAAVFTTALSSFTTASSYSSASSSTSGGSSGGGSSGGGGGGGGGGGW